MRRLIGILVVAALAVATCGLIVIAVLGTAFTSTCLSNESVQLRGDTNQAKVFNFWRQSGFSVEQATGITLNIQYESGYSPFRQEESARWPQGGYGIAQFTGGQRDAATKYVAEYVSREVGASVFETYYSDEYGGRVSQSNGYMPDNVPAEVNDLFLSAQLSYLLDYMASFKPSSIAARTNGLQSNAGLVVPREVTLLEYMKSLGSPGDAARAWTFLYEFPGDIHNAANNRAAAAEAFFDSLNGSDVITAGESAEKFIGVCGGGTVVSPTNANGTLSVTSGTGTRTRSNGTTRTHQGIDIVSGDTIQAIMSGTVEVAGPEGYYGWTVKIDHGDGTKSLYAHMVRGSLLVKVGDSVVAGQPLGLMGNTGDSEGVHLHLQVWLNGKLINPFAFLREHGMALQWSRDAYPVNEKSGPIYQ